MPDELPKDIVHKQSIDQYTRFLQPTIPKGQYDYYNPRMPLVGKELSTGNIEREDMISYLTTEEAILEFMEEGQLGLARFMMTTFQSEIMFSKSFEGRFMEYIGTNKFEYVQKQDITEHIEQPKKKGFFSRR
jgi:hypothetical protein